MSWNAKRYAEDIPHRLPDSIPPQLRDRLEGSLTKITRHHQPPQHPDNIPRIIRIDERHHRAFHLLFGAAPDLESCIAVLKRDWFKPDSATG